MRVLGIETSCDETGVAVYDTAKPGAEGLRDGVKVDYAGLRQTLASQGCCSRRSPAGR